LAGDDGLALSFEERCRDSQKIRIRDERTLLVAHQERYVKSAWNVPRRELLDGSHVEID